MIFQEDKKELTCNNRERSVVLDGNLNIYLLRDGIKLWINYEE